MSIRDAYLRGGEAYDVRATAQAIERVANMLDAADNHQVTKVYPELYQFEDMHEIALAWTWAAVLIADMTDADSATLRALSNAIASIYTEVDNSQKG